MARIATGSIVADISGKVGDNIYSRNRQGPYVKEYVSPVQPDSVYQLSARDDLIAANVAWNNLSDDQYTAWVAFTSQFRKSSFCGSTYSPEPRSFFIGNYLNKVNLGISPIPTPELPANIGFTHMDVEIPDPTTLFLKVRGGSFNFGYKTIWYTHPSVVLGRRSINSVSQMFFNTQTYTPNTSGNWFDTYNTRFPGSFPSDSGRLFASARIIHKSSGIMVNSGWNSTIGSSTSLPYNIGNTDIRTIPAPLSTLSSLRVITTLSGTIAGVTVYILSPGGNILVGLYDDNAGNPNNLIASSASLPVTATAAFQTFNFSAPFIATATTPYHIAIVGDGGSIFVQSVAAITKITSPASGFNLIDPWASPTTNPNGTSSFVTVTA
jgi:hypothetical protein